MPDNNKLQIDRRLLPIWNETAEQQAARIYTFISEQLDRDPTKKIALIYSANNGQAEQLHNAYQTNAGNPEMLPNISGGGQAILFSKLIQLINKKNQENPGFAGRVRVLPIATSLKGGVNTPGNIVSGEMIKRDLDAIQHHLQHGYDVIGIPRTETTYAIGGGYSKYWLTKRYATVSFEGLQQSVSQDAYVQGQLSALSADVNHVIAKPIVRFQSAGYRYAVEEIEDGRYHVFQANYKGSMQQFANLKGDFLKTQILCYFESELDKCEDSDALNAKIDEFKRSPEYAVLKKGQGLATRLFRFKTDSILVFDKMIEEDLERVNKNHQHYRS